MPRCQQLAGLQMVPATVCIPCESAASGRRSCGREPIQISSDCPLGSIWKSLSKHPNRRWGTSRNAGNALPRLPLGSSHRSVLNYLSSQVTGLALYQHLRLPRARAVGVPRALRGVRASAAAATAIHGAPASPPTAGHARPACAPSVRDASPCIHCAMPTEYRRRWHAAAEVNGCRIPHEQGPTGLFCRWGLLA